MVTIPTRKGPLFGGQVMHTMHTHLRPTCFNYYRPKHSVMQKCAIQEAETFVDSEVTDLRCIIIYVAVEDRILMGNDPRH